MMLWAILLAAGTPVYGTDIPESFKNDDWLAYTRCFRTESNYANDPWPETKPVTSTIGHFAQVIEYCGPERARAGSALRKSIQARHPEWTPAQVADSAEFVLTGYELQTMVDRRWPQCSTHEMPCEEF